MKTKLDRTAADQYEMESIIRKQSAELSRAKTLLAQAEYDLKETRFEMNQSLERESKLKEERKLLETKGNETISDLKAQLERKTRLQDERSQVGVFECDKLIKTISSLYKSVFDSRNNTTIAPKTTKQLLDKVMNDAEHLREFLRSKSASLMSEEQENVSSLQRQHHIINVRIWYKQYITRHMGTWAFLLLNELCLLYYYYIFRWRAGVTMHYSICAAVWKRRTVHSARTSRLCALSWQTPAGMPVLIASSLTID